MEEKEEKVITDGAGNKNKIALIVVLAVVIIGVAIWGISKMSSEDTKIDIQIPAKEGYETYINNTAGIGFQYSNKWIKMETQDVADVFNEADITNSVNILNMFTYSINTDNFSVIYQRLPYKMSMEQYVNAQKQSLESDSNLSRMTITNEGATKYGDNDAYQIEYKLTQSGMTICGTQVYFMKDKKAFAFTYTAFSEKNYDNYKGDFEEVLNSIIIE